MKARLTSLWDTFRTSYWFVPSLMLSAAIALAIAMPRLDDYLTGEVEKHAAWLVTTASAARASLSAIAGAMFTVTGVVFSITIVALSVASSQFGSRLVRAFMVDRVTNFVLGTFVATSIYCLLVLRTVRTIDGSAFVPHLSVGLGVAMAVLSLGVLIYFIHHVAVSIQAPHIVQTVAADLDESIERLFPEEIGDAPEDQAANERHERQVAALESEFQGVHADCEGVLQVVDAEGLLAVAQRLDGVIRLCYRPGEFIVRCSHLVELATTKAIDEATQDEIRGAFIVGMRRTPLQDVEAAVVELVEVAVRALSPSINDPFTAVACIDRLGAALARFVQRKIPSPYRIDEAGVLRVVASPVGFPQILELAFGQIRHYGKASTVVAVKLLDSLAVVAGRARRETDREALAEQAAMVRRAYESAAADEPIEERRVSEAHERLLQALGKGRPAASA